MKFTHSFLMLCLIGLFTNSLSAKNYFVSPNGNDNASGTTIKEAWKTIDRVNKATFEPGDRLLFESGGVWHGQLFPKGSGAPGKPILLSKYGGVAKPVIDIDEAEGAGIRLTNQSWWEIADIEVTSGSAPTLGIGRQGIVAVGKDGAQVEHIVVRDCYVHDIWGQLGGNTEYTGYNSCGILVLIQRERGKPNTTTINDVLIENNRIERFDKCGIIVRGPKHNVMVRGNQMDNLGGDGIFVNGCYRGMIERNIVRRSCMRSGYQDLPGGKDWWPHTAAIWIQDAEETIMQFNEVYDTGREPGNGDGEAYDFDFNCKRCILQYNYSKNNAGFLLIMYGVFENIARYNISENDKTHLIQLQCDVSERNLIYNNVFYVDYGTLDMDFFRGDDNSKDPAKLGAMFYNNIFYASGQARFRTVYAHGPVLTRQFDETIKLKPGDPAYNMFQNNCYFGPWKNGLPNDDKKIVADPLFVAPGTGGNGLNTVCGYMLQPNSPLINAGILVPNCGTRDYFGNPVEDGKPDVGAYEQIGAGAWADPAIAAKTNADYAIESNLAFGKYNFPRLVAFPDKSGKVTVHLSEPLDAAIAGTISVTAGGKTTDYKITPKLRNDFTFTVKGNEQPTTMHVTLTQAGRTEAWDIPFGNPRVRR